MTAYEYCLTYGEPGCERVAREAGTNLAYFKHIVYQNRIPSPKMARKLVAASAKLTPANVLDLEGLLYPELRHHRPRDSQKRINWRRRVIQP